MADFWDIVENRGVNFTSAERNVPLTRGQTASRPVLFV